MPGRLREVRPAGHWGARAVSSTVETEFMSALFQIARSHPEHPSTMRCSALRKNVCGLAVTPNVTAVVPPGS